MTASTVGQDVHIPVRTPHTQAPWGALAPRREPAPGSAELRTHSANTPGVRRAGSWHSTKVTDSAAGRAEPELRSEGQGHSVQEQKRQTSWFESSELQVTGLHHGDGKRVLSIPNEIIHGVFQIATEKHSCPPDRYLFQSLGGVSEVDKDG